MRGKSMPRESALRILAAFTVFTSTLLAQHRVDPGMLYYRVWMVVPMTGSGTPADPQRPMFVPAAPLQTTGRPDILGFQMQASDDGKFALVEFVFRDRIAFHDVLAREAAARGISAAPLKAPASVLDLPAQVSETAKLVSALESAVPGLEMFERGKATQAQVLAEFQKRKKGFQFSQFTVRVQ